MIDALRIFFRIWKFITVIMLILTVVIFLMDGLTPLVLRGGFVNIAVMVFIMMVLDRLDRFEAEMVERYDENELH